MKLITVINLLEVPCLLFEEGNNIYCIAYSNGKVHKWLGSVRHPDYTYL